MDLLKFFEARKKVFPTLWILVQKKASAWVVEVGCEQFFALSGYVLAPRRTWLGVRCYERLAMLSMIVNSLYIDPDFIAVEEIQWRGGFEVLENVFQGGRSFYQGVLGVTVRKIHHYDTYYSTISDVHRYLR
jgi:hypothetical protein